MLAPNHNNQCALPTDRSPDQTRRPQSYRRRRALGIVPPALWVLCRWSNLLCCSRLRLSLARSTSKVVKSSPRLRFGLVCNRTNSTARSIAFSSGNMLIKTALRLSKWPCVRRNSENFAIMVARVGHLGNCWDKRYHLGVASLRIETGKQLQRRNRNQRFRCSTNPSYTAVLAHPKESPVLAQSCRRVRGELLRSALACR